MASRLKLSVVRVGFPALSGTAIPLLPPSAIGITPQKLGVVQGKGTIMFTLNGRPRWLIDVSRFAGTATLTSNQGR